MESDWKKLRAMVPILRERYLALRNAQVIALLTAGKKSETERFWDAMDAMEKEAKVLRLCFDDLSRSKMQIHMLNMIRMGMLTPEDLADFSNELQHELSDGLSEKAGNHNRQLSVVEGIALGEQGVRDGLVRSQADAKHRSARWLK